MLCWTLHIKHTYKSSFVGIFMSKATKMTKREKKMGGMNYPIHKSPPLDSK